MTWCLTSKWKWVTVASILWFSDFALYLEGYLMFKHDTLERWVSMTWCLTSNKSGSLWPIFHGSVILPYILKAIWGINMIPWNNEWVWLDSWPQKKSGSLWPIFYGSVILPYILKAIWCINMIPWNNESVWLDAWPQNKSGSLWPIFHGSVILPYIFTAIWCINMIPWNDESVWLDSWPQNKVGHCDLFFMVQWFCLISWRLFEV